jgi:outer membrane protein TolC
MMRRVLFVTLLFAGLCTPAFAGENWIDQFLNKYRPTQPKYPASVTVTQDTLPGLIRDGMIPLSISDLINLTLENNLDIAVERLAPVTSEYAILTNYRPFEPTITVGANVTRNTSPSQTFLTGVASVKQLTNNFSAGYAQTLKTGTDLTVDFSLVRTSTNNTFSTFNPAWVGQMRYGFTQRLLNGFGTAVNTRSIRVAQNNKTISEAQFETQVLDLVTQAQKSYWDLVFTTEDRNVKQRALELAEKTLSDNQRQVEVGTLARIDLVQARSQVATSREDVIVADFTHAQIQDQIKKVLTRQPDPGLVLARVSPTQRAERPVAEDLLPVENAIRVALENRPELRTANLQLRNSEIEIQYAKNQLLPTLSVSADYIQSGVGGPQTIRNPFDPNAPPSQTIPGGVGDVFNQIFKSKTGGYTVGFNLQVPLSNRSSKAEYSRVATVKKTSEENIKALEQQIALEVRNSITAVEMNKARIDTAQTSRELAEEQYAAEQRKFELGASTVRFVLEEQRNLEQAQSNEISAIVNYRKSMVDYDRALGVTLKKNNINIEKTLAALK